MKLSFSKMHGLGNDYILIDHREPFIPDAGKLAKSLCNRNYSIGADGLVLLEKSDSADMTMKIFNSDGSEAEMCGNGIRCLSHFAYLKEIIKSNNFKVETQSGVKDITRIPLGSGRDPHFQVNMGSPQFDPTLLEIQKDQANHSEIYTHPELPLSALQLDIDCSPSKYTGYYLTVGNPHFVIPVESLEQVELDRVGPFLEKHPCFPEGTNVSFFEFRDRDQIKAIVWERGAGPTLACGTAATAISTISYLLEYTKPESIITLPGGNLTIHCEDLENVLMTGPATLVFEGEIER